MLIELEWGAAWIPGVFKVLGDSLNYIRNRVKDAYWCFLSLLKLFLNILFFVCFFQILHYVCPHLCINIYLIHLEDHYDIW